MGWPGAASGAWRRTRKEVQVVEWVTPDFEEVEVTAEVTAYAGHW
jgi:coenzyme PQQ precursor peptide PqqA